MNDQNLYEVGAEYQEIVYDGVSKVKSNALYTKKYAFFKFWDWFVKITPLQHHLKYQPSYLLAQFAFIFGGIATLIHGNLYH